ncbi:Protein of unknown function [Lactobacillus delbrueckii subsp. lactis]|nr:Protein of unknown function [Lactobacillus delbrueckii subsp. lactis]
MDTNEKHNIYQQANILG